MVDCYWSLFNQRDQSRFDGLRTLQIREIIKTIPVAERALWLAWKEGDPEWLPLTSFAEFFNDETIVPMRPPGANKQKNASEPLSIDHGNFDETASNASFAPEPTNVSRVSPLDSIELDPALTGTNIPIGDLDDLPEPLRKSILEEIESANREQTQTQSELLDPLTVTVTEKIDAKATAAVDTPRKPSAISQQGKGSVNKKPQAKPDPAAQILPDADAVFDIDDSLLDGFSAELDEGKRSDKRKANRYRTRLDALVEYGGAAPFKTKTIDVSMGGIQLDKPLPGPARRHIKIILSRGKHVVEALCEPIPERDGKIHRFKILSLNRVDLLRSWLLVPGN